ncbi:putative cytochrome 93A1-like [Capsicum annuum]|nr:putative cytochrome 93A1-like [Capsicum annuum]
MEARCLYFTLFSASNLQNVRKCKKMKVYAKVSVAGKSKCTEVDLENGTNPKWNTPFKFIIPEENIIQAQGKISIKIELFCKRSLKQDKYVGEVNLSLDSQCAKSCNNTNNTCSVDSGTNSESSNFGTLMYASVLGDKFTEDHINKNQMAQIGATIGTAMLTAAVTVGVAVLL